MQKWMRKVLAALVVVGATAGVASATDPASLADCLTVLTTDITSNKPLIFGAVAAGIGIFVVMWFTGLLPKALSKFGKKG